MSYEIQVDRKAGRPTDEEILKLVNYWRDDSLSNYDAFHNRTMQWYALYRGIYSGADVPSYRHDIRLPLLYSFIWADVAHKAQLMFGAWPIAGFVNYPPEGAPIAAKNEALVSAQMRDANIIEKAVDFFASADVYGTAFTRISWKKEIEKANYRTRILDQEVVVQDNVTLYDGPYIENCDLLDVWPEFGKRRMEDCQYVQYRYFMELDQLKAENAQAAQAGTEKPWLDSGIKKLEELGMPEKEDSRFHLRVNTYRNFTDYKDRSGKRYSKPVEMVETFATVTDEFAINGDKKVHIVSGNGGAVLRYRNTPFWHRKFPFDAYTPMPDLHSLHGVGKVEIAEKLQATANKMVNQKLDILELFMNPQFLVDDAMQIAGDTWISRPGRLYKVNTAGKGLAGSVMPLQPDLRGVQAAFTEIEQLAKFMEQGIGISRDTMQGQSSGGRETARGTMIRREAALTRISLEAMIAENQWFVPMVTKWRKLNAQYLTTPMELNILGGAGETNPITGLGMPQKPLTINLSDLNNDYMAKAVGPTQILSKQMRVQNLAMFSNEAKTNQIGLQIVNWTNFFREFARATDLDPQQLLVTDIPAVNAAANENPQGDPTGLQGMSPGASELEGLDPAMLGQQPQESAGGLVSGI